ncbi:ML domain-containing protein [Streptomyces roseoviridis]|uniref:ML domain-containing protein n=1 Tax=Streptomyces roseoviridis TaxID=67361 RepID=UPI0031E8266C
MTTLLCEDLLAEDAGVLVVEKIEFSPEAPEPGAEVKIVIRGVAQAPITEGASFDVTVKTGQMKLHQERLDLYELIRAGSLTVEGLGAGETIAPGPVTLTYTRTVKRAIPRTRFNVKITGWNSGEGGELLGLDLTYDCGRI